MKPHKNNLLVCNETGVVAAKSIQELTCNVLPKLVRHDTMEGRDYIVVPMVILTEGVHNGSEGALYYGPDELGKTPVVWNHKPIVVYHPEMNGQAISACDPSVITSRKVGLMMNTVYEKGRLKSEAWLEKDRADKVDERIMAAVENSEMMEVSTGVFVDQEQTPGEWKGEKYTGKAINFRPDHLAILPDKIGACSIADGAGFLRNQEGEKKGPLLQAFSKFLQRIGLADNEMSQSNTRDALSAALRTKLGVKEGSMNGPYCYITDVYSDFIVYEWDNKLYRLGYSATDTGVALSDDKPVEVKRVTEYRTVEGAYVGNQSPSQKEDTMDKKKLVDDIIANGSGWLEADRPTLMALNEDQLKRIKPAAATPPAAAAPAVVPATNATPPKPKAGEGKAAYIARCKDMMGADAAMCSTMWQKMADNVEMAPEEPKTPVTVKEYVETAPPEIREVLNNSMSLFAEEKTKLVDGILANKNHGFTKEDLQNKPLGELRNLARLAGMDAPAPRIANYGGQASISQNTETEEPMVMPVMNFGKSTEAAAK